jgi:hypothetical protein
LQSLWRLAPVLDALQVDDPVIHITQTAPGEFDFDDVLAHLAQRRKPDEEPSSPLRFALYNIAAGGAIDFNDRTVDKVHQLRQLKLELPFLSNFADREIRVIPRLAFDLNGSAFDSAAQATPFRRIGQTDLPADPRFRSCPLRWLHARLGAGAAQGRHAECRFEAGL